MIVVDYFSRCIEISTLDNETSHDVVQQLKSIFTRHGIPQQVFLDNGPQHSSTEFSDFAKFVHITSSPKFPQSNGEAERELSVL